MELPFITYKSFNDPEMAKGFAAILGEHHITYKLEEDRNNLDATYGVHPLSRDYQIKLKQEDFTKATDILHAYFKEYVNSVDKDYYLYQFNDEELMEVLAKPDEWGEFNYELAKKILAERGKEITSLQLKTLETKRLETLNKPEKSDFTSVALGYILAILFSPGGIFVGYILTYWKKRLPNGRMVYAYNESLRTHGTIIMVIGSIFTFVLFWSLFFR